MTDLKDSKTRLQELLQGRGESLPGYVLESAVGEPHEQIFSVRCVVHLADADQPVQAVGVGSSRRRAEQEAAAGVLRQLGEVADMSERDPLAPLWLRGADRSAQCGQVHAAERADRRRSSPSSRRGRRPRGTACWAW